MHNLTLCVISSKKKKTLCKNTLLAFEERSLLSSPAYKMKDKVDVRV